MDTVILKSSDLNLAIASLKAGNPVVFPTETVYGLGAPLFSTVAVEKIFAIKGRPSDNPLIAHVSNMEQVDRLATNLPDSFYRLAKQFWPGPLTLIVPRKPEVPSIVSAGHPTIAIRMPSHPVAQALINGVGEPLVAPSANLSGRPSPTCIQDVLEDLNGKVHYAIDGGECDVGLESTVLSLCHAKPTLLRPGQITRERLEEFLNTSIALPSEDGPILSPGMKYRHYAPKARLRLVYKREDLTGSYILLPTARTLYAELRKADRKGIPEIEVFCDASIQANEALMNRLLRSSGQIN